MAERITNKVSKIVCNRQRQRQVARVVRDTINNICAISQEASTNVSVRSSTYNDTSISNSVSKNQQNSAIDIMSMDFSYATSSEVDVVRNIVIDSSTASANKLNDSTDDNSDSGSTFCLECRLHDCVCVETN